MDIMRPLSIIIALGFTLLFAGCGGIKGPVSFYLSNEEPTSSGGLIPTNPPALVVARLRSVFPDPARHTITINFFPADASAIQAFTTDNIGKTVVMVQGSNVLSVAKVLSPVPPDAGLMIPVNTNLDFRSVYRALSRLE